MGRVRKPSRKAIAGFQNGPPFSRIAMQALSPVAYALLRFNIRSVVVMPAEALIWRHIYGWQVRGLSAGIFHLSASSEAKTPPSPLPTSLACTGCHAKLPLTCLGPQPIVGPACLLALPRPQVKNPANLSFALDRASNWPKLAPASCELALAYYWATPNTW